MTNTDGGYCAKCDTVWSAPGVCNCNTTYLKRNQAYLLMPPPTQGELRYTIEMCEHYLNSLALLKRLDNIIVD